MDDKSYSELKTYLRQFGWALASLPERDRDDIVEETRVHVLARIEQGQGVVEALGALGSADAYAARFVDEMEISGALASQRSRRLLAAVASRAHRSAIAALGFLGVIILGAWGIGWCFALAMKPFDTEHVGVWRGPHTFFVGVLSNPTPGLHELAGGWIYPIGVLNLILAWFAVRLVLDWSVRRLARGTPVGSKASVQPRT